MLGGVFICYRREDSAGFARLIYDRLTHKLGQESVFFDVDNIPVGLDFVDILSDRVGKCEALIAVIGRSWASGVDDNNRRRLDDPNDFVRIEIEAALARKIRVIPVLVDGAAMPRPDDLPDSLKKLTRRQGIEISHSRFDSDVERLTRALSLLEEELRRREAEAAENARKAEEARQAADAERAARVEREGREADEAAARAEQARRLATTEAGGTANAEYHAEEAAKANETAKEARATISNLASPANSSVTPPQGGDSHRPAQNGTRASSAKFWRVAAVLACLTLIGATLALIVASGRRQTNAPTFAFKPPTPSSAAPVPAATAPQPAAAAISSAPNAAAQSDEWLAWGDLSNMVKQQAAFGYYPETSAVQCERGLIETRAHWLKQPPGMAGWFLLILTDERFNAKNSDLTREGFTLRYDHALECGGLIMHQALWTKTAPAEPKAASVPTPKPSVSPPAPTAQGQTSIPAQSKQPDKPTTSETPLTAAQAQSLTPTEENQRGDNYFYGRRVEQDYAKAMEWYRKAADQGLAEAQHNVGALYENGWGVTKDIDQATAWYQRAADRGDAFAKGALQRLASPQERSLTPAEENERGDSYFYGRGVEQDYAKAMEWYRKAADEGLAEAQHNVGTLYENGWGVAKDVDQAKVWYQKAADQGDAFAQGALQRLSSLTTQASAQTDVGSQSANTRLKDSEAALVRGNEALGATDYSEAVRWYREAAAQGNAQAEQQIGFLYYNGLGVPHDYTQAAIWYRRAAERGLPVGESSIGWMYQNGFGVPRDYAEALRWNGKATEQGDMNGQQNLGRLYLFGLGVPKDEAKARYLFSLAAAQGSSEAKALLSSIGR